jgi:hypothetical protein
LTEPAKAFVLSSAAYHLRAAGRVAESAPAQRAALSMNISHKDWRNAAIGASNLSETELLLGNLAIAVIEAKRSVEFADLSGSGFDMITKRASYAHAQHTIGLREEAETMFLEAEARQRERQPEYPLLYSVSGHRYCELLLAKGEFQLVYHRAQKLCEWNVIASSILDRACGHLALSRSHLGVLFKTRHEHGHQMADQQAIASTSSWFLKAIEDLRASGQNNYLLQGLLARSTFRRSIGDWNGTTRDLDEVEEIAEPGPMRLYLCDMALERARLAFARIEAFAPLNRLLEDNPPKPIAPNAAEAARLRDDARVNLAEARKLVTECGYHRRDEELAELEAVLAGTRRFADLPPRV